jgi:hypothetical protein
MQNVHIELVSVVTNGLTIASDVRGSETFSHPVFSLPLLCDAATRDWCDTGKLRRSVRSPASTAKHVIRCGCHSRAVPAKPAPAYAGALIPAYAGRGGNPHRRILNTRWSLPSRRWGWA